MFRLIKEHKGVYIIIIELCKRRRIKIGRLREILFEKGYYMYVGSGQNNLHKRVFRHTRKNKVLKWHIDYLTEVGRFKEGILFYTSKRIECNLASILAKNFRSIKGFGSSDCKCDSHLFYSPKYPLNLTVLILGL